jgi:hypothetical protein
MGEIFSCLAISSVPTWQESHPFFAFAPLTCPVGVRDALGSGATSPVIHE